MRLELVNNILVSAADNICIDLWQWQITCTPECTSMFRGHEGTSVSKRSNWQTQYWTL